MVRTLVLCELVTQGRRWGVKGAKNNPRGERLLGSIQAVKARSPILGGDSLLCMWSWASDRNSSGFQVSSRCGVACSPLSTVRLWLYVE